MTRRRTEPKCRICGCTQFDACPGGCGWAEKDLCTVCAAFRDALLAYVEDVRRVSAASLKRLYREALISIGIEEEKAGAR